MLVIILFIPVIIIVLMILKQSVHLEVTKCFKILCDTIEKI